MLCPQRAMALGACLGGWDDTATAARGQTAFVPTGDCAKRGLGSSLVLSSVSTWGPHSLGHKEEAEGVTLPSWLPWKMDTGDEAQPHLLSLWNAPLPSLLLFYLLINAASFVCIKNKQSEPHTAPSPFPEASSNSHGNTSCCFVRREEVVARWNRPC